MKKPYFIFILMLISVIFSSCSKKDPNPAEPGNTDNQTNNQTTPSIPNLSFKGPTISSLNSATRYVSDLIDAFIALPEFLRTTFTSIQPVNNGNEWKWVYTYNNGATETFTATRNSDGSFTWNVTKNGRIGSLTYNNWKVIDGNTSNDGKSGGCKVYKDSTSTVIAQFTWLSSSLKLTGKLTTYRSPDLIWKTEVDNNYDKSGALRYKGKDNEMIFQAAWNASGSGTWKSYSRGVETGHGTLQ